MQPVDRASPVPLWAQVLDDLRKRLDAGEFAHAFPTDAELTETYGVSRHTVRDAVRRLQSEGVVRRERGRGTTVTAPTIEQATGALYSLFRSIEAMGLDQRSEVLDLSVVTDNEVATRLGRDAGDELVRLERVRYADADPLAHDVAWLPAQLASPLLDVDFTHTALYDELQARCGTRPNAGTEWISTEVPSSRERSLLGMAANEAAFRIRRLGRDAHRPIEWRVTLVRGDRYTFVASWSPSASYQTALTAEAAQR